MKKIILLAVFLIGITGFNFAQVGIGTATPNTSAMLDISSTTKGFLPPRITTVQRDSIASPANGLVIFNTTLGCLDYFNNGAWYSLVGICNVPAGAAAGIHVPSGNQVVWNWLAVSGAIGYKYNILNNYATATDNFALTTYTETGIACGDPMHTLYVWAYNNCGNSVPLTLNATPASAPSVTGNTPSSVCGTGMVTLGATASAGILNWYAAPSGGASLGTGTVFITPAISVNTAYYVDATDNGCTTATRSSVLATVYAMPAVLTTSPASRCGTGTVSLAASASAGTLNWYADLSGGTSLGTGTIFITPAITVNTTYYVDATDNGCTTTTRSAVLATVNAVPSVLTTSPASICGTGTLSLGATASAGILNWYADLSAGTSLGTGTTFITPVIAVSTTYYVDATDNGCTTAARIAVPATVNDLPVVAAISGAATVIEGHTTSFTNSTPGGVWGSSNTNFATIDVNGLVTAVAAGSLTITYMVTAGGCSTTVSKALTVNPPFVIGQFYMGGYIFYIDATGEHGFIAYPNDIGGAPWGCYGAAMLTPSGAYGMGKINTAKIVADCSDTNSAAYLCYNLSADHRWFLPSGLELVAMCALTGPAALAPVPYWSSTEATAETGFCFGCIGGGAGCPKTTFYNVRPAAAF